MVKPMLHSSSAGCRGRRGGGRRERLGLVVERGLGGRARAQARQEGAQEGEEAEEVGAQVGQGEEAEQKGLNSLATTCVLAPGPNITVLQRCLGACASFDMILALV